MLTSEYVRYRKAYSESIAAGALTPDKIKQIERDHERAKAKIIGEQREEDLRAERSAYGIAGSEWAQDAPVTIAAPGQEREARMEAVPPAPRNRQADEISRRPRGVRRHRQGRHRQPRR